MQEEITIVQEEMNTRKYGWKPDLPDFRDQRIQSVSRLAVMPRQVDLRPHCPGIWNQGSLGACTSHAINFCYLFDQDSELQTNFMPSRLFTYYNERAIEGTIDQDAGAQIRDGIKSVNWKGVCREDLMPYNVALFAQKPTWEAYQNAKKHKAVQYMRVDQTVQALQNVLAQGHPIVFGFTVYSSFESSAVTSTGIVPMPDQTEKVLGGHAVAIVGYDADASTFTVRNSWGSSWGDGGYCHIPYDYVLNSDLADDFWVILTVERSG